MSNKDFQYQYELSQITGKLPVAGVQGCTITPWPTYEPTYPPYVSPSLPGGPTPLPYTPRIPTETEEAIKKQVEEWRELQEEKNKQSNKVQPGTASRFNKGKRRWNLLPLEVFEPVVKVLEFGANKYAAWNFAEGDGLSWTEVLDSMKRHIMAWERGEDADPESGESHLGHIGCNLMFLLYYMQHIEQYGKKDDRKKR